MLYIYVCNVTYTIIIVYMYSMYMCVLLSIPARNILYIWYSYILWLYRIIVGDLEHVESILFASESQRPMDHNGPIFLERVETSLKPHMVYFLQVCIYICMHIYIYIYIYIYTYNMYIIIYVFICSTHWPACLIQPSAWR